MKRTTVTILAVAGTLMLASQVSAEVTWSGTSPPFYAASDTPSFPPFHYRCYLDRAGDVPVDAVTINFDCSPGAYFGNVSAPDMFTSASFSGILTATFILGPTETFTLRDTFSTSDPGGFQSVYCYTSFSKSFSPSNIASFAGTERFAVDVDFTATLDYTATSALVYPEFYLSPDIIVGVAYDRTVPEPGTLSLLALGGVAALIRRRNRR
ncbi:MAG: PEP-CTERM sorting domain-containing protein [Planctomycetota bacterium]|nr:PEP-CTERM sorting domain-containing protein [Planctomycetota bacterium]